MSVRSIFTNGQIYQFPPVQGIPPARSPAVGSYLRIENDGGDATYPAWLEGGGGGGGVIEVSGTDSEIVVTPPAGEDQTEITISLADPLLAPGEVQANKFTLVDEDFEDVISLPTFTTGQNVTAGAVLTCTSEPGSSAQLSAFVPLDTLIVSVNETIEITPDETDGHINMTLNLEKLAELITSENETVTANTTIVEGVMMLNLEATGGGGGGGISSVTSGNANQIVANTVSGAVTLNLPSLLVAPGEIQADHYTLLDEAGDRIIALPQFVEGQTVPIGAVLSCLTAAGASPQTSGFVSLDDLVKSEDSSINVEPGVAGIVDITLNITTLASLITSTNATVTAGTEVVEGVTKLNLQATGGGGGGITSVVSGDENQIIADTAGGAVTLSMPAAVIVDAVTTTTSSSKTFELLNAAGATVVVLPEFTAETGVTTNSVLRAAAGGGSAFSTLNTLLQSTTGTIDIDLDGTTNLVGLDVIAAALAPTIESPDKSIVIGANVETGRLTLETAGITGAEDQIDVSVDGTTGVTTIGFATGVINMTGDLTVADGGVGTGSVTSGQLVGQTVSIYNADGTPVVDLPTFATGVEEVALGTILSVTSTAGVACTTEFVTPDTVLQSTGNSIEITPMSNKADLKVNLATLAGNLNSPDNSITINYNTDPVNGKINLVALGTSSNVTSGTFNPTINLGTTGLTYGQRNGEWSSIDGKVLQFSGWLTIDDPGTGTASGAILEGLPSPARASTYQQRCMAWTVDVDLPSGYEELFVQYDAAVDGSLGVLVNYAGDEVGGQYFVSGSQVFFSGSILI